MRQLVCEKCNKETGKSLKGRKTFEWVCSHCGVTNEFNIEEPKVKKESVVDKIAKALDTDVSPSHGSGIVL